MSEEKETIIDAEQTAANGELSDKDVDSAAGGALTNKIIDGGMLRSGRVVQVSLDEST